MDNTEVEQLKREAQSEVLRVLTELQAKTGKYVSSVAFQSECVIDATIHDRHAVKSSGIKAVRIELAELTV